MKLKDALKGIAIALTAAYFFPIVCSPLFGFGDPSNGLQRSLFILFISTPILGLIFTFWLVIPLGAVFGILIPQIARLQPRQTVMLYGLLLGLSGGTVVSIILSVVKILSGFRDGYWRDFAPFWLAMSVYSAVWTSLYTYWQGRQTA
jgi:hypothetical protein